MKYISDLVVAVNSYKHEVTTNESDILLFIIEFSHIKYEDFSDILKSLKNKYNVIKSVNIGTSNIRSLIFNNTTKTDEVTFHLSPISNVLTIPPYKVYIVKVSKCVNSHIKNTDLVCVEYAYVSIIDNMWEMRLIVKKQLSGFMVKSHLKLSIETMFNKNNDMTQWLVEPLIHDQFEYNIKFTFIGDDVSEITVPDVKRLIAPIIIEPSDTDNFKLYIKLIADILNIHKKSYSVNVFNIASNVIGMTHTNYRDIFPPVSFIASEKIDGEHGLVMIDGSKFIILTHKLNEYPKTKMTSKKTIFESEIKFSNPPIIFPFDVLMIEGKNITHLPYVERLAHLDAVIELCDNDLIIIKKSFIRLAEARETLKKQYTTLSQYSAHPTDGIILTDMTKSYIDTYALKWKPMEFMSIDFLVKKCPYRMLKEYPYILRPDHDIYLLFVTIRRTLFNNLGLRRLHGYQYLFSDIKNTISFPIQFATSMNPYSYIYHHPRSSPIQNIDGKIVELKCINCGQDIAEWKILRIRHDKDPLVASGRYFGNSYQVAELTWMNYVNPFTFEQLWEGPSGYFKSVKNQLYVKQTSFMKYIKQKQFKELSRLEWVIDLGVGQGQDIHKYIKNNVKNLIAIDQDKMALSELINRKYSVAQKSKIAIHILITNLILESNISIKNKIHQAGLPHSGADAIVCNLALHYFFGSTEVINKLIHLCYNLLKPGGMLTIIDINGKNVFDILSANNGEWKTYEQDVIKFQIKQLYREASLSEAGQKIAVLLPFSLGKLYEEFLMNKDTLSRLSETVGFKSITSNSFSKYIDLFNSLQINKTAQLDTDEKIYVSLFDWIKINK